MARSTVLAGFVITMIWEKFEAQYSLDIKLYNALIYRSSMDITWKELFAFVVAIHTITSENPFHSDNKAEVDFWEAVFT